ncbi:DUF1345 domain-containing protein [Novosphingobium sp. TH158]|uniref:DUF1345 domain-containing protein n=1 Tax=Novosphingobium sp. TH158 TaxID=2067455 RepID=UPI00156DF2F9|nr:DUF1345 domain-containing protein [Novosphingobium sp. TH158]
MSGERQTLGNRLGPPRFLTFLLLLPLGYFGWHLIEPAAKWQDALAMGFDFAAALFLLSLLPLLRDRSRAEMRRHSQENDANRPLVLLITLVVTFVILAAISGELAGAKAGDATAMTRLIVTLALTWLFANSVYALHYAHAWYAGAAEDAEGIAFPGTKTPSYSDFAYFAFTLGMTFQTSDADITSPALRRVVLLHSMAAFAFNIGIIAFTINALG